MDLGTFQYYYDGRPTVEESNCLSVSTCIRQNLPEFIRRWKKSNSEVFDLKRALHVKEFLKALSTNLTFNMKQELGGKISYSPINKLQFDFSSANLGSGYLFWFICNLCGKRARKLYVPRYTHVLACRRCHRLTYKSQRENIPRGIRKLMSQLR